MRSGDAGVPPGSVASKIAVLPGGKLLVVWDGNLLRLLPDGKPDTSFGNSGVAHIPDGEVTKFWVLRDGSLVANVWRCNGSGLAKFRQDGTLDPGFAMNTRWFGDPGECLPWFGGTYVSELVEDPGGRIVTLEEDYYRIFSFSFLRRYLPNGQPDHPEEELELFPAEGVLVGSTCTGMALGPDGALYVECPLWGSESVPDLLGGFAISKLWVDSTVHVAWGTSVRGITGDEIAPPRTIARPRLYEDSRVLLAGCTDRGYFLVRVMPDGGLDDGFGDQGKLWRQSSPGGQDCPVKEVVLEPDGSIVGVGSVEMDDYYWPSTSRMAMLRLFYDGSEDPFFGPGGLRVVTELAKAQGLAIAQQADGALAVAGRILGATSEENVAVVARFTAPGLPLVPASYFGEGAAVESVFEPWLLLYNPDPSSSARARVRMYSTNGARAVVVLDVPPASRRSIRVPSLIGGWEVVSEVEVLEGSVEAERAFYALRNPRVGSMLAGPRKTPALRWIAAEGATAGPFETWVVIYNPQPYQTATARLRFLTNSGPLSGPVVAVRPKSRVTLRLDDHLLSTYHVATEVVADVPVTVERSTYISGEPSPQGAATLSGALSEPDTQWYFAEGATRDFDTWILIANPGPVAANVSLDAVRSAGSQEILRVDIPPGARVSVPLDEYVFDDYHVASVVRSGVPIVAERAQYGNGGRFAGTASTSEGSHRLARTWAMPEGATAGPFTYFVTVANPSSSETGCVLTTTTSLGTRTALDIRIAPSSRKTLTIDDYVQDDYEVGAHLVCEQPVAAEHTLYSAGYLSGDATSSSGIPMG